MLGSIRKALALVAFLSLLAALRDVEAQTEPQNEPANLEGTSWQLVRFGVQGLPG